MTNGRVNALWNNLFDHARRTIATERWPMNFLEISANDAAARDIESGDLLSIESDDVLDQLGQAANAVTSADTTQQPLNLRYNFKLGKGRVSKIGTTDLARTMSFAPRNIPPS